MISLDKIQKEELRATVLAVLAARQGHAHSAAYVLMKAAMEIDFSLDADNVNDALLFLSDLKLVRSIDGQFGSSLTWVATAEGVLNWERNTGHSRPRRD